MYYLRRYEIPQIRNIMKKAVIYILAITILAGCTTTQQARGTMMGYQLGATAGGLMGLASDTREGHFMGTAIGALTGAAIGYLANSPKEEYTSNYQQEEYVPAKRLSRKERKAQERLARIENEIRRNTNNNDIAVGNVQFITESGDNILSRNEYGRLTFEIYNRGNRTIRAIYPYIECSNDNIGFSDATAIEHLRPGEGIRYSTTVYTNGRMRNGNANIIIYISTDGNDYRPIHKTIIRTNK